MQSWVAVIFAALVVVGCTPNIGKPGLELGDGKDIKREVVGASESRQKSAYTFAKKKGAVDWMTCKKAGATRTVLMINPDNVIFEKGLCRDWHAQTFLSAGYSVLAVNRPGYGRSDGEQDFGGPRSRAAVSAAVKAAKMPVTGVWGVQTGTIVATFWAKDKKGINWAILGNGIYDLEEFASATKSAAYKRMIGEAKGKTDIDDFNEARSIAWDTSGLPKKIQLYHGKLNTVVPMLQGASFRDTLAAEEYSVALEEVPKSGHDFAPGRHRLVLEALLKRFVPKPQS